MHAFPVRLTCEDVGCELLDEIYEHLDSSIPISLVVVYGGLVGGLNI